MDYIGWFLFLLIIIVPLIYLYVKLCKKKDPDVVEILDTFSHLEDEHTEDTNYVPLDTLPPDYSFSSGENET